MKLAKTTSSSMIPDEHITYSQSSYVKQFLAKARKKARVPSFEKIIKDGLKIGYNEMVPFSTELYYQWYGNIYYVNTKDQTVELYDTLQDIQYAKQWHEKFSA